MYLLYYFFYFITSSGDPLMKSLIRDDTCGAEFDDAKGGGLDVWEVCWILNAFFSCINASAILNKFHAKEEPSLGFELLLSDRQKQHCSA